MTQIPALLNEPFNYYEYGINYDGIVYVSQQSVVDRLNSVIGYQNWELEPIEIKIDMEQFSVSVLGKLKVYDSELDRWITRTQYGNDTMTILTDEDRPRAQAIEDAKKSAMSDCLKKCASWFGVASDIFKRRLKSIKPTKSNGQPNSIYQNLLQVFGLNEFDYRNGIVILPNDYKAHYEANNWSGIFESDLDNVLRGGFNASPNQGQINNNGNNNGQPSQNGNNRSNSNNNGNKNSNRPQEFRIQMQNNPKKNSDGTATFGALLETHESCTVIVPRAHAEKVVGLNPGTVLHVSGWLNQNSMTLKLANNGEVKEEAKIAS